MPYSRPWTTNRCRCVPVQPKATCSTACRPAIDVSAGTSSRRQISGLTPRTTTRSWYTLGKGAGCVVSGMAPILASRCGRMAPGTAPPTVCPALAADARDADADARDPESEGDSGGAVAAGGGERDGGEQRGGHGDLPHQRHVGDQGDHHQEGGVG